MTIPSGEVPPDDSAASVRLHITPLDPDLLKVVLSSALLPKAKAISYHALETFPEKRYGFLELPAEDAEKLKKKLNGAVVKGQKIRIQTARPASVPTPLGEAAMAKSEDKKKSKDKTDPLHAKKRKRDVVLEGAQLDEGRKVKRGWTAAADEPQDKDRRARKEKGDKKDKKEKKARRQEKSKFTDHAECLVKTILPPTAVPATDASAAAATSKSKKKKNAREVVVHEFEKTTKFPTFLKTTVASKGEKAPLEFVEGKGWVDETGAVIEPVKSRPATRSRAPIFKKRDPGSDPVSDGSSSSSSSGTDELDEEDESDAESTSASPLPKADGKGKGAQTKNLEPSSLESDTARPKSSGSPKGLSIRIPPATPKDAKVHPLEALYKRPAPADGAVAEPEQSGKGFSFFGHANSDASDNEADEAPKGEVPPMTPFTRRDIETRGIRSAAPTPDTAHPGRRFKPWEQEDDDIAEVGDEDEEMGEDSPSGKATQLASHGDEAVASDFQKWFWENRGDINRSWKKRRKQAGKEKRYRENRARMARAI